MILADARHRYPKLPKRVYRWAQSHYCEYIGYKCNYSGDRWGALLWLSRAVILDPVQLLYHRLYLRMFKRLLKKAMGRVYGQARKLLGASPAAAVDAEPAVALTIGDIESLRSAQLGAWDALQKRRMSLLSEMETGDLSVFRETGPR